MSNKKYSRVYEEITNICNKNCSFCHGTSRAKRQMSREEFCHVADEISRVTDYIYFHVMGEPLTHPDFPLFLKMARESGYKSVLTTNGTLLDKCGDKILDAGIHKVNISVHSFENGTEAQFENYMANLVDFAKKASPYGRGGSIADGEGKAPSHPINRKLSQRASLWKSIKFQA